MKKITMLTAWLLTALVMQYNTYACDAGTCKKCYCEKIAFCTTYVVSSPGDIIARADKYSDCMEVLRRWSEYQHTTNSVGKSK